MTCLFVRLCAVTWFVEQGNAEEVRSLLNRCFDKLAEAAERHGGYVAQALGHEILVLFGAPVALGADAARALGAALALQSAISDFQKEDAAAKEGDIRLACGVNTGWVVAGGRGSRKRREYAVVGDTVNLAARLAQAAQLGQILVGHATQRLCARSFTFHAQEPLRVQGKRVPVVCHELLGAAHRATSLKLSAAAAQEIEPVWASAHLGLGQVRNPWALAGERKAVAVLFADLSGFTALSESLSPEALLRIMNGLFESLTAIVSRFEGYVDKFIGDEVMALFGAPVGHEDDAERAAHAALEMMAATQAFNETCARELPSKLALHMGLDYGTVIAGGLGPRACQTYSVVGPPVVSAEHLADIAEPGEILIGDALRERTAGRFEYRPRNHTQNAWLLCGVRQLRTRLEAARPRGWTTRVGRGQELGSLERAWADACQGHGQALVVSGEAGVGKSRLVHDFATSLAGAIVHVVQTLSHGRALAYHPFVALLRSVLGLPDAAAQELVRETAARWQTAIGLSERHVPFLLALMGDVGHESTFRGLSAKERTVRTHEAFHRLLTAASAREPVLIVIEDVHWLDDSSAALLNFLTEAITSDRLLLVSTSRPQPQPAWAGSGAMAVIALSPLSAADTGRLVDQILSPGRSAPTLAEFVMERTQGVPLFAQELVKRLQDGGNLAEGPEGYVLTGEVAGIPQTVQEIIAARLDQLPTAAKRVAQLMAVVGAECPAALLGRVMGGEARMRSRLNDLSRERLVHEQPRGAIPQYRLAHALIRDVAYDSLLRAQRQELHAKVANAMVALAGGQVEEQAAVIAYHFRESALHREAVVYSRMAGRHAVVTSALVEAERHYENAVATLELLPESTEVLQLKVDTRLDLHFPRFHLHTVADDRLLVVCTEALQLAEKLGDPIRLTQCYNYAAGCAFARADYERCLEYKNRFLKQARSSGDVLGMAAAAYVMGGCYLQMGRLRRLREFNTEYSRRLEDAGSERELAGQPYPPSITLLGMLAVGCSLMGDFAESNRLHRRATEIAKATGSKYGIAIANVWRASSAYPQGDGRLAVVHGEEATRFAREAKLAAPRFFGMYCAGVGRALEGEYAMALSQLEAALHLSEEAGYSTFRTEAYYGQALALLGAGDLERAKDVCQRALAFVQATGERKLEAEFHRILGDALAQDRPGSPEDARPHLDRSLSVARDQGAAVLEALAQVSIGRLDARQGLRDVARMRLSDAAAAFRKMGAPRWTELAERELEWVG